MSTQAAESGTDSLLRPDELVDRDGVLHRPATPESAYRRRWESEAESDHVRSATAVAGADDDFAHLVSKISPLWERFPRDLHVPALLEIGAGYGRIPLFLGTRRGLTFSTYCAVDISDAMLRRLLEYRRRFALCPDATVHAVCVSADTLPIRDEAVDVVVSSAVFLHMGKSYAAKSVREIARVLKPGGSVVFDVAFPNAGNPVNAVHRLKPRRLRPPHFLKYWTRAEIERLLVESGLEEKAGPLSVEPGGYAVLPKSVDRISIPLARPLNALVARRPFLPDVLATSFDVYSRELIG